MALLEKILPKVVGWRPSPAGGSLASNPAGRRHSARAAFLPHAPRAKKCGRESEESRPQPLSWSAGGRRVFM